MREAFAIQEGRSGCVAPVSARFLRWQVGDGWWWLENDCLVMVNSRRVNGASDLLIAGSCWILMTSNRQ